MLIDDREYHTRITEEATAVGEILQSDDHVDVRLP
jgi:hypothetical protein